MPSYARRHQLEKSLIYHIYNRSHRRERIFERKEDFEHFTDLLHRFKENFAVKIYHWVIMSNHYHLCLELDNPETISRGMSGLQKAYTHYYNRTREVRGYLWESRFKSQAVEGQKYLTVCGRYIERNPVRARMVQEASQYPYSSVGYYCLGIEDGITDADLFYDEFGDRTQDRQKGYTTYLGSFDGEEESLFREMIRPIGSQAFKARLVRST